MRLLVTGGAGFVGASLALAFKRAHPGATVVVLDNLRRRGSEQNIARLGAAGIRFVHGDVRNPADLTDLDTTFDIVIDAAAEPSVSAGTMGSPAYVLAANLGGTINTLEFARGNAGVFILLSTSRVYSIAPLRALALEEQPTRFEPAAVQPVPGASGHGIAETFPVDGARSFYGASKLSAEHIAQEYAEAGGLDVIIDRCGVLAGAGQFGKTDQGVVALWAASHVYGTPLRYIGFGGTGKQVRDVLHPDDLYALLVRQVDGVERCRGQVFNVGGGAGGSASLQELTALCRDATGSAIEIGGVATTAAVDIPYYVTDNRKVEAAFGWQPQVGVREIVAEIVAWVTAGGAELAAVLGGRPPAAPEARRSER